jgi:hypothetical protein
MAWVAFAVLAGGCRTNGKGTLHARWASIDTTLRTGTLSLPVTATWCESRGRLTLLGVRGDTGIGILVRTVKLGPGRFVVADTTARPSPGAAIALRVTVGDNLFTLSADSGAVALTSMGEGRLDGRFVAWLSKPAQGAVTLIGDFAAVPTEPDSAPCESFTAPAPAPPSGPDSGVT